MNNILENKKILVTGASSGIGKAIAIYFSKQGAQVILSGRNQKKLTEIRESLNSDKHLMFASDLSTVDGVKFLMDSTFETIGPLDSIVHCAGIQKTLPLQALKENHFEDIFATNVKSAQFIAKFFRRKGFYNPNGSSLTFLSSVAAICGEPAISTYAASKAALQGMSKSLAIELARNKIRVNCIAPGVVQTEMAVNLYQSLTEEQRLIIENMHPLGLGKPDDIAYAAAFLSSDYATWITGTTLYVDGGYSAH